jgi:hypothetical protein
MCGDRPHVEPPIEWARTAQVRGNPGEIETLVLLIGSTTVSVGPPVIGTTHGRHTKSRETFVL